jgi:hypothetical protein
VPSLHREHLVLECRVARFEVPVLRVGLADDVVGDGQEGLTGVSAGLREARTIPVEWEQRVAESK